MNDNRYDHDVVIVGSGVAGAMLAAKLASDGLSVAILEAGPEIRRQEALTRFRTRWQRTPGVAYERLSHAMFPEKNNEQPYLTLSSSSTAYWANYLRGVGGSTWHWTGITPRFLPADFRLRSQFSVGRDWPIHYHEIEPYYLNAEYEMGVSGDSEDDHGSPRSGPYPMAALPMPYSDQVIANRLKKSGIRVNVLPAARNSATYQGRPACCGNNNCTPICPIGAQYSANIHVNQAIQHGARVLSDTVAYKIDSDPGGVIGSVRFRRPDRTEGQISARHFVIACNGIETPKLLLMSASENNSHGIANRSGLVGRNLMDHPTVAALLKLPEPIYTGRGPQVVSQIDYARNGDFRKTRPAGKIFIGNQADVQPIAIDLIERKKEWAMLDRDIDRIASRVCMVGIEMEQLPSESNFIRPSQNRVDSIGIPLPEVHMSYDQYSYEGARYYMSFLEKIASWLDADVVNTLPMGEAWPNHPMGTTIMGDDPDSSVVDKNCRTHDHPNLWIIGSSVFPSGGTANPTLTIAALSLRLANHLARQVK